MLRLVMCQSRVHVLVRVHAHLSSHVAHVRWPEEGFGHVQR